MIKHRQTGFQSTGSVVVVHGLNCSAVCGIHGPEIEPMSPILAGGFFTTEPPGQPLSYHFYFLWLITIAKLFARWFSYSLVAQLVKNLPALWETRVQSLGWEDPLEKGKTTQSSILAWRIPWTKETGRLQSIVLQRVRND